MKHVFAVIGGICLVVTLVAIGFAACTLPITTRTLSSHVSLFSSSPYLADELVELACATRDFTVDDHTALRQAGGPDAAANVLAARILDAARASSAQGSEKHAKWEAVLANDSARRALGSSVVAQYSGQAGSKVTGTQAEAQEESYPSTDALAGMYALAAVSDEYALDAAAISHLDDCNRLIRFAIPVLIACAVVCAACALGLGATRNKKVLGRMLAIPSLALLAAFVALGVWAYLDFYGFFAAFHGVFFPQGNWTFSAYSLLISMYPQDFWMAMGILWLALTALAAIMCSVVGSVLMRASGPGKHAKRS